MQNNILQKKVTKEKYTVFLDPDLSKIIDDESIDYREETQLNGKKRFSSKTKAIIHYLRLGMRQEGKIK